MTVNLHRSGLVTGIAACLFFLSLLMPAGALPDESQAAQSLIERVMPGHAGSFICETIPQDGGKDVFEIEARDKKIVLRGNAAISIAMAFNWYLRYVAKTDFGWEATGPLQVKGTLPMPGVKIRQVCSAKERFFLNYCTYGYTFPWWNWDQWQRLVDWMAMNGVNRPLLQCGQEATWLKVWKSYGLEDETIRAFFSGPAHLPWHRMANLDKWGGPLPLSYIDGQMKLQQEILARARRLGMKPILGGFAGHVPEALKKVKPDARITQIAPGWGGMEAKYATWFLDPTDPLFKDIQHRFLKEQQAMYGTDHLYGADPFNELTPPSWEPEYLAGVSKTIYESMAEVDPAAVWYQMSWTFFYDSNWTQPRLKALTMAVPEGKMVYLDYVCEQAEFFRKTGNFYGAPFIWCYIGNFGGNTLFVAPMNLMATRIAAALPIENCLGVGSTLEGININPITYDMLFEQPWHKSGAIDMDEWIAAYATRRAGQPDPAVAEAWRILQKEIFLDNPYGLWGRTIILQSIPHYQAGQVQAKASLPLKQKFLTAALEAMLRADKKTREADGYKFDIVNLTRQSLGNAMTRIHSRMMCAVAAKDLPAFRRESAKFLELGRDIDELLGTRSEFLLGRWIADARGWGTTPEEQDYYEGNARQIITTWHKPGGGLTEYAARQWNGLIRTYYLAHWEEFIRRLDASLSREKPFDQSAYLQWRVKFDGDWVNSISGKFPVKPTGDPYKVCRKLFNKYRSELVPVIVDVTLDSAGWSPRVFKDGCLHRWILDVTGQVPKAGSYKVCFRYKEGDSALSISRVELRQNGKQLAVDAHDGWTGHANRDNTYKLKVDKIDSGKPVSLVMDVEPASSVNTAGTIELQSAE